MSQVVQAPNVLVIYDYTDTRGSYQAVIELTGSEGYNGYAHGHDGIPSDIYFGFFDDDALESGDPSAALARHMENNGYIVDETCSASPVGAVVHVVHNTDTHEFMIHSHSKDGIFIREDELFDLDYAISSYEEIPLTYHHDWWYISESC